MGVGVCPRADAVPVARSARDPGGEVPPLAAAGAAAAAAPCSAAIAASTAFACCCCRRWMAEIAACAAAASRAAAASAAAFASSAAASAASASAFSRASRAFFCRRFLSLVRASRVRQLPTSRSCATSRHCERSATRASRPRAPACSSVAAAGRRCSLRAARADARSHGSPSRASSPRAAACSRTAACLEQRTEARARRPRTAACNRTTATTWLLVKSERRALAPEPPADFGRRKSSGGCGRTRGGVVSTSPSPAAGDGSRSPAAHPLLARCSLAVACCPLTCNACLSSAISTLRLVTCFENTVCSIPSSRSSIRSSTWKTCSSASFFSRPVSTSSGKVASSPSHLQRCRRASAPSIAHLAAARVGMRRAVQRRDAADGGAARPPPNKQLAEDTNTS